MNGKGGDTVVFWWCFGGVFWFGFVVIFLGSRGDFLGSRGDFLARPGAFGPACHLLTFQIGVFTPACSFFILQSSEYSS